jgi:APA family basic amino acid/polyamine antiporter
MNIKKYFKTLSIENLLEDLKKSKDLARTLTWFDLVMLGIGAIIGAGIFVYTGTTAAENAGPALVISFALAGLACACTAFCYAELASAIPTSGSAYTYTYATFGEFPAWLIAGMMTLTCCFGAASVASGWSAYALSFLSDYGIEFPASLSAYFGAHVQTLAGEPVEGLINVPAILITMLLGYVVMLGAETSAIVNSIIVFIKFFVLLAFILLGMLYVDPDNWSPFIPENTGTYGHFGISGIIAGASTIMLAYSGFDAVATAAQETKNPKRDLVIYMLVSLVMTGLTHYSNLNVAKPIAVAVDAMHLPWFSVVIKIGAIAGLTTVILVLIYASVRIFYSITHDGLLPEFLAKTHKKHKTPHLLTMIMTLFVALLATTLPAGILVGVASFGTMVTFTVVCLITLYLRVTMPELKREFLCPLVPFVPLFGVALFGWMLYSSSNQVFIYVALWLALFTCVYVFYGRHHSHLLHPHKKLKKA